MYIETERLVMQPIPEENLGTLMALLRSRKIAQTYMLPDFESEGQCLELAWRLRELSLDERRCVMGIYLGRRLIGFANDVEMGEDSVELGYVIDPAYQNRGYGTEALKGIIACLQGKGFREVTAGAFEENAASIRVMVKAGMVRLDRQEEIEYRGKVHRCVYYAAREKIAASAEK